jgi:hypothetical protein
MTVNGTRHHWRNAAITRTIAVTFFPVPDGVVSMKDVNLVYINGVSTFEGEKDKEESINPSCHLLR